MRISDFVHNLTDESSSPVDESESVHESDIYSPPSSSISDSSDADLANFNDLELEDANLNEGNRMPVTVPVPDMVDSNSESHSLPVSDLEKQDGRGVEVVQIKKKKVVRTI
jgi:hypothetical protein